MNDFSYTFKKYLVKKENATLDKNGSTRSELVDLRDSDKESKAMKQGMQERSVDILLKIRSAQCKVSHYTEKRNQVWPESGALMAQNAHRTELILMFEQKCIIFGSNSKKIQSMLGFKPATCRIVRFYKWVITKKLEWRCKLISKKKVNFCYSLLYKMWKL